MSYLNRHLLDNVIMQFSYQLALFLPQIRGENAFVDRAWFPFLTAGFYYDMKSGPPEAEPGLFHHSLITTQHSIHLDLVIDGASSHATWRGRRHRGHRARHPPMRPAATMKGKREMIFRFTFRWLLLTFAFWAQETFASLTPVTALPLLLMHTIM